MAPPRLAKNKPRNVLRFRCDGVEYALDRDDLTPRLERELFTQAGVTPQQAFQAFAGGATFGVAAVLWLARRQAGEAVAYQVVEDGLWAAIKRSGEDEFDLALLTDDEEGDPAPEA